MICSQFERPNEIISSKKHNLGKKLHFFKRSAHNPHTGRTQAILRGVHPPWKIYGKSIDAYRCPWIPMDVYGYLRIFDEGRKSRIQHASKIEPSGGKSHAPDSIFRVSMANSRILASKPLASSCLGGNHEVKSISPSGAGFAGICHNRITCTRICDCGVLCLLLALTGRRQRPALPVKRGSCEN